MTRRTLSKPPGVPETLIAAPVVELLARSDFAIVQDRPVLLTPTIGMSGGKAIPDVIARKPHPERGLMDYVVCEVDDRIAPKIMEQCSRWVGIAHQVYAVIPHPRRKISQHLRAQIESLQVAGIGTHLVNVEAQTTTRAMAAPYNADADPRVLAAAFDRPVCAADPPAGSTGAAERNTEARGKFADATAYVHANPGETLQEIERGVEEAGGHWPVELSTPAAARKLIRSRTWTGVKAIKGTGSRSGKTVFVPA